MSTAKMNSEVTEIKVGTENRYISFSCTPISILERELKETGAVGFIPKDEEWNEARREARSALLAKGYSVLERV